MCFCHELQGRGHLKGRATSSEASHSPGSRRVGQTVWETAPVLHHKLSSFWGRGEVFQPLAWEDMRLKAEQSETQNRRGKSSPGPGPCQVG